MCGEEFGYFCPICKKILIRDFGITPIVKYKDMSLFVTHCYKCNTKLAIQPIKQYNKFFIETKGQIYDKLIWDTKKLTRDISIELNEDEAQEQVLKNLENKYSKEIVNANKMELKQIIQSELCNHLLPNVKGYIYEEIENECKDGGCIAF